MATWPGITDDDGSNTVGTVINNANVWSPIYGYIGQGGITRAHNGGNFTQDTGTWTVESGDVGADRYLERGKCVRWTVTLNTTSVSGTPGELRVALPGGFLATGGGVQGLGFAIINGTDEPIRVGIGAGVGYATLRRFGGATWPNSTNNTYVFFQIEIEIA